MASFFTYLLLPILTLAGPATLLTRQGDVTKVKFQTDHISIDATVVDTTLASCSSAFDSFWSQAPPTPTAYASWVSSVRAHTPCAKLGSTPSSLEDEVLSYESALASWEQVNSAMVASIEAACWESMQSSDSSVVSSEYAWSSTCGFARIRAVYTTEPMRMVTTTSPQVLNTEVGPSATATGS
jgi:hypothetical protein